MDCRDFEGFAYKAAAHSDDNMVSTLQRKACTNMYGKPNPSRLNIYCGTFCVSLSSGNPPFYLV